VRMSGRLMGIVWLTEFIVWLFWLVGKIEARSVINK
jgi:hypothetical protein